MHTQSVKRKANTEDPEISGKKAGNLLILVFSNEGGGLQGVRVHLCFAVSKTFLIKYAANVNNIFMPRMNITCRIFHKNASGDPRAFFPQANMYMEREKSRQKNGRGFGNRFGHDRWNRNSEQLFLEQLFCSRHLMGIKVSI